MSNERTGRSRTTRYPAKCHIFARRLWDDGRTIPEIREALAKVGYHPTRDAVVRWVDPERHEAYKARQRLNNAAAGVKVKSAWWAKRRRMRQLREAGLSYSAIAKVMNLDYGTDLDAERARYLLKQSTRPEFVLKRASREAVSA